MYIYIYIREMPFEFPVGRAAMKMSRLYIYTWFCDVFDPRFLTFCSICCFLGIKR